MEADATNADDRFQSNAPKGKSVHKSFEWL